MARRSVPFILAVAALAVVTLAGVVLTFASGSGGGLAFGDRVAILEVEGLLADDEDLLRQIDDFRDDGRMRALVVAINSPGGVVGPSQSIFTELQRLRDEDGIPVVASIGAVGASGGYYVALAADSIFALPGSITGSIGVIMESPDASGLMEKVGVRMEVVESAEHKDVGSPFRPLGEGDRAILGALVQDVYEQFVGAVVEERGLSREAVLLLADGRILSGRQALAGGLVDRLGNVNDAIAAAGRMADLGDRPDVLRPAEESFDMLDVLLSRAAVAVAEQLRAPRALLQPRLLFQAAW